MNGCKYHIPRNWNLHIPQSQGFDGYHKIFKSKYIILFFFDLRICYRMLILCDEIPNKLDDYSFLLVEKLGTNKFSLFPWHPEIPSEVVHFIIKTPWIEYPILSTL